MHMSIFSRQSLTAWGLSIGILIGLSSFSETSFSLDLKPKDIRARTVEKPVAVLQKRYFKKKFRPELGILEGGFLNEAYTKTEKRGVRLSMFFSEWLGLELQYVDTTVSNSDDKKALDKLKFKKAETAEGDDPDTLVSPQPEVNKVHTIIDAGLCFAPFYGKINLMDFAIVYLDTYITLGGASLDTQQGAKTGISAGIGQRYYFGKSFSMRLDFRNHSFTESRNGKTSARNQQSWDLGLGWFFF